MRHWTLLVICIGLLSATPGLAKKEQSLSDQVAETVKAALVTTPKDGEACFSPEEPCDRKLIKFIESAQTSVDMAIYDINLDQLVHQVLLVSRRLPVRIVVDRRQAKGSHSLVPVLVKAGGKVRFGRQRGIFHNKFVIVDGSMIQTGSFNYTNHAAKANNENQIYLANPAIVKRYRDRFEQIWQTADSAPEISKRESLIEKNP